LDNLTVKENKLLELKRTSQEPDEGLDMIQEAVKDARDAAV